MTDRPVFLWAAYKGRATRPFRFYLASTYEKALKAAEKDAGDSDVQVVRIATDEVETFSPGQKKDKR